MWLIFLFCACYKHHLKNPRKEVNAVLKKEAAYFGDIVILPFMDRYELVVLKTVAICEFGVSLIILAASKLLPLFFWFLVSVLGALSCI